MMAMTKSAAGILRRPSATNCSASSTRPVHGSNLGSPMQTRAVYFQPPENLRDLLIRAANEKNFNPKLQEELEGHLTHLKNQRGAALLSWLQLLQENIRFAKIYIVTHAHSAHFITKTKLLIQWIICLYSENMFIKSSAKLIG